MLARAQITIRDEREWEVSATPPVNPVADTLWMDTSTTPHTMKRWNGSAWVSVGADTANYYTKTELETRFEQTDQAIALKANETTVTALSTRVASAEQKITPTAIVSTVRANAQYLYDLYHGRNYVLQSHGVHMFVDNLYRYASGATTTYTGYTLPVSDDLFAHSGNGANIRMSFDIKRTGLASTHASSYYTGVWVYYRYLAADGVTVSTTGRGWFLRTTDADFASTDSDWVHIEKGPLNLSTYAPLSIAYFQYGSTVAGVTGTVQFRNVKLEVGNAFTGWSAAPEDLGSLPGRMTTAETSITQNASNIALKVSTSAYNTEKVYRGTASPTSPTANMLWLDISVTPNLLKRYTGSAWVAAGAEEVKASGIYIGPDNVSITTEKFLLQLLDPANNENVLMEMSAEGNVGFKELFADRVISDSVAAAYDGPSTLYVNPSYASGGTQYFPSLGEAVKVLSSRCLKNDVTIYLPSGVTEVYEMAGVHLRGITGPGRLTIYGYSTNTLNSYITVIGCQAHILFQNVRLRESRTLIGGVNRNSYLIECRVCHFVELNGCTLDANGTTYDSVYCAAGWIALYNCGLYNALQGLEVYRGMAQVRYCRGSCSYSMVAYASVIFAYDTVPAGTRAYGENGVVYSTGVTVDYGSAIPVTTPDSTMLQYATLTRSYQGGWRADTLDAVQGLYSDYGYSPGLSWNYGCLWFGKEMTRTMQPVQNNALLEGVEILRREVSSKPDEALRRFVAVYARVSTDKEEQVSSLKTQMEAFHATIASRPGWELFEVYADEGLSGTQAKNRTAFQRMMADCEAGKIHYIITKSISRFARNTMECLQYVRRLKELGVYVYFDKERLDTATATSEMLLSILAAAAQEESRSLSENLKWGYRKRFAAGEPKWVKTYGFVKGEDGEYVIHEEQARGVRRIFTLCLEGHSLPEIGAILAREGIPAMGGGKWWPKSLATVLHNEKYCGDVMMQKTCTVDHITHKKVRNDRTVLPSFYVRDHHEAIVSRKTFALAERILSLKDRRLGCVQYPYDGLLRCPVCGEKMIRFAVKANGRPMAWTCGGCGDGAPSQCAPYAVKEKYIDQIVKDAYAALDMEMLEKLVHKRNPGIRNAVREALSWKEKAARLDTIPFMLLDDLVERITFRKWSEGEMIWKFGVKTRMRVEYERISDIPCAELEQRQDGYYLDGERVDQGRHVNACLMNLRENVARARAEAADHAMRRSVKDGVTVEAGKVKNLVMVGKERDGV